MALTDRFGDLPTQAEDLLASVRIKWIANGMGLEKLVLKKGKMIGYFIADQQSEYYQSATFTKILQLVQANNKICTMKEKQTRNGLRLLLVFEGINTLEKAMKAIHPFHIGHPVMSS
jgi:transcription-repair coupling factor (superfamily II helicase)